MTVNLDGKTAGLWGVANVAVPFRFAGTPPALQKGRATRVGVLWSTYGSLRFAPQWEIDLWVKVRVRVSSEPPGNTKGTAGV
jgi:hypothetical protein